MKRYKSAFRSFRSECFLSPLAKPGFASHLSCHHLSATHACTCEHMLALCCAAAALSFSARDHGQWQSATRSAARAYPRKAAASSHAR